VTPQTIAIASQQREAWIETRQRTGQGRARSTIASQQREAWIETEGIAEELSGMGPHRLPATGGVD